MAKPTEIVGCGHFQVRAEKVPGSFLRMASRTRTRDCFSMRSEKIVPAVTSDNVSRLQILLKHFSARHMEHRSRFRSVDHGWLRVLAFVLLGDAPVLTFIQNIRLRPGLPCGCAGNALFSRRIPPAALCGFAPALRLSRDNTCGRCKWISATLREKQRIVAGQLGTSGTTSSRGQ